MIVKFSAPRDRVIHLTWMSDRGIASVFAIVSLPTRLSLHTALLL